MSRDRQLAAAFAAARPRLVRMAYAVLGSQVEAEDVVSDCWLRLVDADVRGPVLDLEAWATVAVARRALDVLRSARRRRETYVGPWLPEPLLAPLAPPGHPSGDPAEKVTLDESVSYALLIVLETLTPAERVAWVLHDLFGLPFGEVAKIVGRTPAAVRQLAARARPRVASGAGRFDVAPTEHSATVAAFARAATTGDLAGLLAVLDPDVILTSDGGGQVSAARRPVHGADRVARFVLGIAKKADQDQRLVALAVNGAPGLALLSGTQPVAIVSFAVHAGRIQRADLVLAPDKLTPRHLQEPTASTSGG